MINRRTRTVTYQAGNRIVMFSYPDIGKTVCNVLCGIAEFIYKLLGGK